MGDLRLRIVVVGAGVIGASVAWHLACRGVSDVLVLDRGALPGTGSTGAATGGFRAQFASPVNVRLSLASREQLQSFHEEVGGDPGYEPAGYLWIARSEEGMTALREALRTQHAEGLVEAGLVDADEIARLQPAIGRERVVGGAFCPTDGYIRPLGMLDGYLAGGRRLGASVRWSTEVVALERAGDGHVVAVRTTGGTIACDAVVNAAGAWAASVARLAGLELPVRPLRRQVAMTVPTALLPAGAPMTLYVEDGFHLRPRDGRVLFAYPAAGDRDDPYATRVEPAWLESVTAMRDERVPLLRGVPIDPAACWAGLYEMSPDKHAILGPAPGCPNLFLANGSSGHGVMHAPILGRLLSEIILDGRASTLDATPLRPGRFAEGAALPDELL